MSPHGHQKVTADGTGAELNDSLKRWVVPCRQIELPGAGIGQTETIRMPPEVLHRWQTTNARYVKRHQELTPWRHQELTPYAG